jgi:hypothetical protein
VVRCGEAAATVGLAGVLTGVAAGALATGALAAGAAAEAGVEAVVAGWLGACADPPPVEACEAPLECEWDPEDPLTSVCGRDTLGAAAGAAVEGVELPLPDEEPWPGGLDTPEPAPLTSISVLPRPSFGLWPASKPPPNECAVDALCAWPELPEFPSLPPACTAAELC